MERILFTLGFASFIFQFSFEHELDAMWLKIHLSIWLWPKASGKITSEDLAVAGSDRVWDNGNNNKLVGKHVCIYDLMRSEVQGATAV